jgi:hypothetical protein
MVMTESTHRSQAASGTGELRTPQVKEKSSPKAQTAGRRRRWARRPVPLGNVLATPHIGYVARGLYRTFYGRPGDTRSSGANRGGSET